MTRIQLFKFIDKIDVDICWNWKKARNSSGYGVFKMDKKLYLAHRVSYNIFVGEIGTGLVVDHICRNRGCVNPKHLRLLKSSENNSNLYSTRWSHIKSLVK